MIIEDFIRYLYHWFYSRRWGRIILVSLPLLALVGASLGFAIAGWATSRQDLVQDYLEAIDQEPWPGLSQDGSSAMDDSASHGSRARGIDLRLRRVLNLEQGNVRATYFVAQGLHSEGRVETARAMMRSIAPEDSQGHLPAHAWLASEALSRQQQLELPQQKQLRHDLEQSMAWGEVSLELKTLYAALLAKEDGTREAMAFLRSQTDSSPELNLAIVDLARANDMSHELDSASAAAEELLTGRINDGTAQPVDYLQLASLYLIQIKPDEVLRVGTAGLQKIQAREELTPALQVQAQKLKRVISNAWLVKFHASVDDESEGRTTVNLAQLEAAMQADPTNPNVLQDVSTLIASGKDASQSMLDALNRTVADGTATSISRLILANYYLERNEPATAIPHLRMAYERDKNNIIVLNNLAFALLASDAEGFAEGIQLTDRALQIGGPNPSVLDTKGQLLQKQGNTRAAIVCYEDAIRLQPDKLNTRERLAAAYESAGMQEMARTQRQRIREIQESSSVTDDKPNPQ